jgi:hypothetical protein
MNVPSREGGSGDWDTHTPAAVRSMIPNLAQAGATSATPDGGEELYDEQADPSEWKSLATDPTHAAKKAELAKLLPSVNHQAIGVDKGPKTKKNPNSGANTSKPSASS